LWWLPLDIDEEQKEILGFSDKLSTIPGRSWFKYKGDVIARTVIDLLSTHVPEAYRVVGPNVYVEGYPTEFDALVVERGSSPVPRTPAYAKDHVRVLIEIKKHGFFYRKIKGKYRIAEYFQSFRDTGKPFLYLTVRESPFFVSATQKILGSDCFFLGVSRGKPIEGEWRRFVERLWDLLR